METECECHGNAPRLIGRRLGLLASLPLFAVIAALFLVNETIYALLRWKDDLARESGWWLEMWRK